MKRAFKLVRLHKTATQMALINLRGEAPPPTHMNQLLVAAAPFMWPVEDFRGLTPLKATQPEDAAVFRLPEMLVSVGRRIKYLRACMRFFFVVVVYLFFFPNRLSNNDLAPMLGEIKKLRFSQEWSSDLNHLSISADHWSLTGGCRSVVHLLTRC